MKFTNGANATGVLATAHAEEWKDVQEVLRDFKFRRSEVLKGGGRKSVISSRIDEFLEKRDWKERKFATKIVVDDTERDSPTHKVDCFKGKVGLEIEWNNKDSGEPAAAPAGDDANAASVSMHSRSGSSSPPLVSSTIFMTTISVTGSSVPQSSCSTLQTR
jgi:hypothetical protein